MTGSVKDLALKCIHKVGGIRSVVLCCAGRLQDSDFTQHTQSHTLPQLPSEGAIHTQAVFTPASPSTSAAIQHCSAMLLRRVINYSLRISALVQ